VEPLELAPLPLFVALPPLADWPLFVRVGTEVPRLGGEPLAVGGSLGSEGTPGTVGPELLLVPAVLFAEGVTTVVAPDPSVGGITVGVAALKPRSIGGVPPSAGRLVVPVDDEVDPVVVSLFCAAVAPPPTTRPPWPSGSTQTTSRFEQ
jgi:hypothetical protein